MGNCTKCVGSSNQHKYIENDRYDQEPDDTEILANRECPTINLHGLLRKFKLKGLSANENYGIRISIDQIEELLLNEKKCDHQGQIKWEIEEKFVFSCTEYELRKKFLHLEVLRDNQVIGSLKINFYLIAVGPYHLDFQICLNQKTKARISFDIKIAQVVSVTLQPLQIEMFDIKQFIGDKYSYSLKTIVGNNPVSHELSYVYQIGKQSAENQIKGIKWSKAVNPQMPGIQNQVPFYQFHYGTLKFIFWRINDSKTKQQSAQFFGECYVSFVKLLSFDSLIISKDNRQFQTKNIELEERLWNHGVECGKIKVKLKFEIQKHIKQMLVCVRTEKGISKNSPVFKTLDIKGKSKCKQIIQINKIIERLSNAELELQKSKKKPYYQRKAHLKSIQNCLTEIITLLQISVKQTIKIYNYVNEAELLKGQLVLLDLGVRIIGYMDEQYELIENLKWQSIRELIKRGQFQLNYIGFHNTELSDSLLEKKKSIALKYQDFLYKLLNHTFKVLSLKRYDEERLFAEMFCAVAYFRIPQFRHKFIELITKKNDPIITEWRGTDFSLDKQKVQFKTYLPGENTFQILFDWQQYFYSHIEGHPKYNLNINHLEELLTEQQWQERISRRRGAFFAFIRQWVGYVERASIRIVHSNWKHFPGYIDILRSFLVQMKLKPIKQYPSSIKLACRSFLANENLLNIFITIIFKKTDIHKSVDVLKILELLHGFFSSLKQRNKRIPSTFNDQFFFNGLKAIIQNEYSFTKAKALYVIYEHFQFFPYDFRIKFANYLLSKIFFNLFLHWSFNVRTIFHHLLVIKIHNFFSEEQQTRQSNRLKQYIINVIQRYNKLLIILENAKKIKEKDFIPTYEKDYLSKLKKNMRKKKLQKRQSGAKKKPIDQYQISNLSKPLDQQQERVYSDAKIIISNKKIEMSSLSAKKPSQRYDSQIISMDILEVLQEKSRQNKSSKDEVIRKAKGGTQGSRKYSSVGSDQDIGGELERSKPHMKFDFLFSSNEQNQLPVLSEQDIKYIIVGMKEFQVVSRQYLKTLKELKEAPKIKAVLTLDSGQMRPEDYGEIEEW